MYSPQTLVCTPLYKLVLPESAQQEAGYNCTPYPNGRKPPIANGVQIPDFPGNPNNTFAGCIMTLCRWWAASILFFATPWHDGSIRSKPSFRTSSHLMPMFINCSIRWIKPTLQSFFVGQTFPASHQMLPVMDISSCFLDTYLHQWE